MRIAAERGAKLTSQLLAFLVANILIPNLSISTMRSGT